MLTVRPWGKMWKLIHTKHFWLKVILVKGRTSLQSHEYRTEYHISIRGIKKIKKRKKHRMEKGLYIEIATGRPDEDDIVRYEDDYGRVDPPAGGSGKLVMVSGGFDPVHVGHLRMFEEAKKLGDQLLVVINSDEWLVRKKGRVFMMQEDRMEIIKGFGCVNDVHILESERDDVGEAIAQFKPHVFANGGDRKDEADIPEARVCKELGIEMVFNVGGEKLRSSSSLLGTYAKD
ncbi:MAG: hypothetical protein BMS9Abin13_658 [Patescibacteria group bacterium]|nr:MAG: hypothetical protein BMS9Abin13_658 [Patescibacteria group bacterium]